MSRLSIIDEPEDAGAPSIGSALAGLILAAISVALVTVAGSAVLVWLGWI